MSNQKLKYPYTWGRGIVNAFIEHYERGSRNLAFILQMDGGELRHNLTICLCLGKSLKFETIKKIIKGLEDYEAADLRMLDATERKQLYKCWVQVESDKALDEAIARDAIDSARQKRLIF